MSEQTHHEQPTNEQYSALALIGVILAALTLFAVFFIGFLVAPLAILLVFYVAFSAMDRRGKGGGGGGHVTPGLAGEGDQPLTVTDRLAREAALRRSVMERQDEEAAQAALEAERQARTPPPPPATNPPIQP
jgi:hypothetical protein